MANEFYNHSGYPTTGSAGASANMRAELDAVAAGFDKLPPLAGNALKTVRVNAAGTALEVSNAVSIPVTSYLVKGDGAGGLTAGTPGTDYSIPASVTTEIRSSIQSGAYTTLSSVSGTNTITATATPTLTSYVAGQTFRFVSAGANTGAVTLAIDGLSAKSVYKSSSAGPVALSASDIPAAGVVLQVTYDGTQFQLVSGAGSGGGATGGGTDKAFFENDQTITTNYTITAGKNAMTAGPVTINSGVTVQVPSGSTWTVV